MLIKKGRIEKPEGFLRLVVSVEQERHNMALLGCAEGFLGREDAMHAFGSEHWGQKFNKDQRSQWLEKKNKKKTKNVKCPGGK